MSCGQSVTRSPYAASSAVNAIDAAVRPPYSSVHVAPAAVGLREHRQDRRDADAARHEDVARCRLQPEVVARTADLDVVAGAQRVVDVRRAAAAGVLAQHAEAVPGAVRGVAGQ